MKLAIFTDESDAEKFSKKIHNFLKENRVRYNADKWSNLNKSDTEDKWFVKIPYDYEKWEKKLKLEKDKDKYSVIVTEVPDNWTINNTI